MKTTGKTLFSIDGPSSANEPTTSDALQAPRKSTHPSSNLDAFGVLTSRITRKSNEPSFVMKLEAPEASGRSSYG